MADGNGSGSLEIEHYFSQLDAVLRKAASLLGAAHPGYIVILDNKLVKECAVRTAISLREYNMSGDPLENGEGFQAPNHLKEAGHYAYWITKIKPLRLFSAPMVAEVLDKAGIQYDAAALGRLNHDRRKLIIKLNEWAAISVAAWIIVASEDELVARLLPSLPDDRAEGLRRRYSDLTGIVDVRSGDWSEEVMRSLRYDLYSPNALVFVVEGMFASGLFNHKCQPRWRLVA